MVVMRRRLRPHEMFPAGDSRFRASRLSLRSGLTVRVVECGDPRGRPILLFPGWASPLYIFRFILPELGAAGYRAITVDLKGHGLSDKPLGENEYTRSALVTHAGDILDALGLEDVVLGGHSMGAVLAMDLARARSKQVRALLLYSPVGYDGVPGLGWHRAVSPRALRSLLPYLAPRWLFALVLRLTYGKLGRPTARDVDEYWAPSQFREYCIAIRDELHQFEWGERIPTPLGTIGHPTLVMFGTRDRFLDERKLEEDAARIPNGEVNIIPGAGHVICEEAPAAVFAATRAFLERLTPHAPQT